MSGPDRIWAWTYDDPWGNELRWFEWEDYTPENSDFEYTRSDLIPAMIEAAVKAERDKLSAGFRAMADACGLEGAITSAAIYRIAADLCDAAIRGDQP